MRLLLIADTHVPTRAPDLSEQVWDEVERADVVVHAGDWVSLELLDERQARAARSLACWGNNDGPRLRSRLPARADAVFVGLRFTVVHEAGAAAGRQTRVSRLYPHSDVLVFGHSHIPWDTTAATVTNGALPTVVLHEVE
ncbi:metallophosphoesterase family protein [Mycobacterium decipiens]|uniref:Phosphoesterase n=1 Tax=Mycobacterium decipiens TaxID=1430326 RepID=A0A1X2LY69_9MYCO|nr:YfcE family phosphodiesterase [Mycobacterium decipiens]OSC42071.1 YfcE family phosphodiesterase [Mycobacterium decipiens]